MSGPLGGGVDSDSQAEGRGKEPAVAVGAVLEAVLEGEAEAEAEGEAEAEAEAGEELLAVVMTAAVGE